MVIWGSRPMLGFCTISRRARLTPSRPRGTEGRGWGEEEPGGACILAGAIVGISWRLSLHHERAGKDAGAPRAQRREQAIVCMLIATTYKVSFLEGLGRGGASPYN